MISIVSTQKAPAAIGPYSQATIVGDLVFTSGQIAIDPATGELAGSTIYEQTEQVMKNLQAVLQEAGCEMKDVAKTTCFLSDINDFVAFNTVYAKYFTGKPARSCVAVAALPKGALCEVEVIAKLPGAMPG